MPIQKKKSGNLLNAPHTHTHTHTHIYIYNHLIVYKQMTDVKLLVLHSTSLKLFNCVQTNELWLI